MLNQILKRRSIRSFLDKEVEQAKIDEIVQAGLYAATAHGEQTGVIVVIKNKEIREQIRLLNAKVGGFDLTSDPFYGAPIILLVMVKKGPNARYDGSTMIENMMIEAVNQKLGTCWIHRAKEEIESGELQKIIKIDGLNIDDFEGVGHIALGYAKLEPKEKKIKPNRVFYIE